jgi:hypothetical protein
MNIYMQLRISVSQSQALQKIHTYMGGNGLAQVYGEWWGTILHYGRIPAIIPGSNKCYAHILLPEDMPM